MREESLSPQPPPLCHLTLKAVLEKEYSLFITDAATEKTKFYLGMTLKKIFTRSFPLPFLSMRAFHGLLKFSNDR